PIEAAVATAEATKATVAIFFDIYSLLGLRAEATIAPKLHLNPTCSSITTHCLLHDINAAAALCWECGRRP
ncbi:MAG: hypothetical protein ABUJ93_08985, partial [Hyphomicrobium sp.]